MKNFLLFPVILASLYACNPVGDAERISLGGLTTGAEVSFVSDTTGFWGIEIAGGQSPVFIQPRPVQVELYRSDSVIEPLNTGYAEVKQKDGVITGLADIDAAGAVFRITDRWRTEGSVLILERRVIVSGNLQGAGFSSAIRLLTSPDLTWPDVSFLAPGLLYGDPSHDGRRSPGGTMFDAMRQYTMREDFLPAPLFAMSMRNGTSLTVLDMAPQGFTTLRETQTGLEAGVMIDERFSFGALGSNEAVNGGVEIGFWLPGTTCVFPWRHWRGGPPDTTSVPVWSRRYNPVRDGFAQQYSIGFRFGACESFAGLIKNACRWAWDVLKPSLHWHDMEAVRRSLTDQLSGQVYTINGRTGLPFIVRTHTGEVWKNDTDPDFFWRATMGFVGKNIEAADQLLRESERDTSGRGLKMRQQAMDIIATFIREVPMDPPTCTGFNLRNGRPSMTNPPVWYVREATEDMRMLMEAYRRERAAGREHPEWIGWCRDFSGWLIDLQRADGSFPRSFLIGTGEIEEESGTTSYNVVPLFVMLSQDLKDDRYLRSALRAAEYVWQSFGTYGVFIGGAIDNPNITDKEAGLLSMEAFLFLYEETKELKWLSRAQVAGDFAESWMYLWNVPMPEDANDSALMWKRDITTVGVQGITAQVAGHVDQYLDWSVPAYARLYRYTGDTHYRELARILLHNCKGMMAMPGRTHGMLGPGWQTENWRMGASWEGRGFGSPEKWMPWVTTNHLYSITGLEQFDKDLLDELCEKPQKE